MTRSGISPNGENLEECVRQVSRTRDLTDRSVLPERTAHYMTKKNWAPYIRVPETRGLLAVSRSCVYDQIDEGAFPPLVKFGTRTAMWPVVLVDALLANRLALRDAMTHLRQRIVLPHWTTWCPQDAPDEYSCDLDDLQLLRVAEVADRLGVSICTVYRFVRHRGLPGPIPLTARARRWLARDITQWQGSCVAVSLRISGELPPRNTRRKDRPSKDEDRPQP